MATLTGKIHSGTATQQKTEKFAMRTFVLEMTDNGYTNYAELQLVNNNCGLLDQFKPGDMVTASYNVRGNLWNSPNGKSALLILIVGRLNLHSNKHLHSHRGNGDILHSHRSNGDNLHSNKHLHSQNKMKCHSKTQIL